MSTTAIPVLLGRVTCLWIPVFIETFEEWKSVEKIYFPQVSTLQRYQGKLGFIDTTKWNRNCSCWRKCLVVDIKQCIIDYNMPTSILNSVSRDMIMKNSGKFISVLTFPEECNSCQAMHYAHCISKISLKIWMFKTHFQESMEKKYMMCMLAIMFTWKPESQHLKQVPLTLKSCFCQRKSTLNF